MSRAILVLFLAGSAQALAAPDEGTFERYKIIFQKFPFGEPPKEVEPVKEVEAPVAPNWINDYRLSMLKPDRAGLVKKRDNSSILLNVGQKHDGEDIQLVSIDVAAQEVKLSKSGDIRSLSVNPDDFLKNRKGPAKTADKKKHDSKYKSFAQRMAERRKAMEAQKKPAAPPKPRLTGVELEKHLQKYQMEVIRKGLPPLPVKLTPEMEKKLVDEGVITPNP